MEDQTFVQLYEKVISIPDQQILPIGSRILISSHHWAKAQKEIIDANIERGKKPEKLRECRIAKYRLECILEQLK